MKHQSPSILNSKVIRISLDTYQVLRGLSLRDGITIAEALTKLITGLAKPTSKSTLPVRLPVPVTAQVPVKPVIKAVIGSTNFKLRATVAGRGSNNGFKQV